MRCCLPLSGSRCLLRTTAAAAAIVIAGIASASSAAAQNGAADARLRATRAVDPYDAFIAEAAHRFGIPERWIRIVMRAESGGDVRAISHKGAIGLMQLMPSTWADMRYRYPLGPNPYDPRDNILAGAAYLRAMYDRFGAPGFLAAYNAGPARYQAFLSSGRPLPLETRIYLARLAPLIGVGRRFIQRASSAPDPLAWTRSPLFVARPNRSKSTQSKAMVAHSDDKTGDGSAALETPSEPPQDHAVRALRDGDTLTSEGLFVLSAGANR